MYEILLIALHTKLNFKGLFYMQNSKGNVKFKRLISTIQEIDKYSSKDYLMSTIQ